MIQSVIRTDFNDLNCAIGLSSLQRKMVNKILFWSGFGMYLLPPKSKNKILMLIAKGIAVRVWQLGIEMRPFFNRESLWVYPLFASVGGSFGYWLQGVEKRQLRVLGERRDSLLEKRRRRAEQKEEATTADSNVDLSNTATAS